MTALASLMENLIDILSKENEEYQKLIVLSEKKTPVLIKGDLDGLTDITEQENVIVSGIQGLEKQRIQIMKDIANVTNQDYETLKLDKLIGLMESRPKERDALRQLHDKLKQTMHDIQLINNRNRELIKNSLEMVEFEMNLLNSMRRAPETGDYNKNAYNTGNIMGSGTKRFDSKS